MRTVIGKFQDGQFATELVLPVSKLSFQPFSLKLLPLPERPVAVLNG